MQFPYSSMVQESDSSIFFSAPCDPTTTKFSEKYNNFRKLLTCVFHPELIILFLEERTKKGLEI